MNNRSLGQLYDVLKPLYFKVFGYYKGYLKGDTLLFLIDLGTLTFRKKGQYALSVFMAVVPLLLETVLIIFCGTSENTTFEMRHLPLLMGLIFSCVSYTTSFIYEDFGINTLQKNHLSNFKEWKCAGKKTHVLMNRIAYLIKLAVAMLLLFILMFSFFATRVYYSIHVLKIYFQLNFLLDIIAIPVILHATFNSLTHSMILSYIFIHLAFQVKILNHSMSKMHIENKSNVDLVNKRGYQKSVKYKIRNVIKHHLIIKRMVSEFQRIVKVCMMILSLAGLVLTATCCFCIIMDDDWRDRLTYSVWLIGCFLLIIAYALLGQYLVDESELMYESCTHWPWYFWNRDNIQNFQIFLVNCQDPIVIRASNILAIDNTLIIKIFRGMFSLLTFLWTIWK